MKEKHIYVFDPRFSFWKAIFLQKHFFCVYIKVNKELSVHITDMDNREL